MIALIVWHGKCEAQSVGNASDPSLDVSLLGSSKILANLGRRLHKLCNLSEQTAPGTALSSGSLKAPPGILTFVNGSAGISRFPAADNRVSVLHSNGG